MASDKLISANDLLSAVRDDISINGSSFKKLKQHIEAAPDAVARCKNCKHKQRNLKNAPLFHCLLHERETWEEAFCSYGERKEDG